MLYANNTPLYVKDKKNNKPYNCYVVENDESKNEIKIHFEGFQPDTDEWISCDSDRIVEREDGVSDEVRIALGNLMRINDTTNKVIACYNPCQNQIQNERNINQFVVNTLLPCAEALSIKTLDENNKKLSKGDLKKQIITKIRTSLPKLCEECLVEYRIDIEEEPLFTCYLCKDASHNCEKFKTFKSALPSTLLEGFVWLCGKCHEVCPSPMQPVADTQESQQDMDDPSNRPSSSLNSTAPVNHVDEPVNSDLQGSQNHRDARNTEEKDNHVRSRSDESTENPETCKRFLKGICPHGLRGKKLINGKRCEYTHKKPCIAYCSYGLGGKFGCKWKKCRFAHPIICKYSQRYWQCTNKACTYTHLKGTWRSDKGYMEDYNTSSNYEAPQEYNTHHKHTTPHEEFFENQETRPKNDQLERIEQMISMMRRDHNEELKKLSTELYQVKGQIQYVGTQNHQIQPPPSQPQMIVPTYAGLVQARIPHGATPNSMPRSCY